MNIGKLKQYIDWDQYRNPNFEWNHYQLYEENLLTEDVIREFQDKVNWVYLSGCKPMSEDFIREFQNKVEWSNISIYQKLSEPFIEEFSNRVDWTFIFQHQKLSEKFKNKWRYKISTATILDSLSNVLTNKIYFN